MHSAVGRTNDAVLTANGPPSLDAILNAPPGLAQKLAHLQGYIELVVPRYDPAATVKIQRAAANPGFPISSAAVAAAGVAVTVFSAEACNQALAGFPGDPDGPQSYGARPAFHGPVPKGFPAAAFRGRTLTDSDVPLGIKDPQERVVATELVSPDDTPLRYNHNGWYHASEHTGRRFDVYRLDVGDTAIATLADNARNAPSVSGPDRGEGAASQ